MTDTPKTDDVTALVERLRAGIAVKFGGTDTAWRTINAEVDVMTEAADTIERLTRERDKAIARHPEDDAELFIQAAIDSAPEPLRRLGEWLANKLDDDDWKTADRLVTGAAVSLSDALAAARDALEQGGAK